MSLRGKDPKAATPPRGRYSAGAMEYRTVGYWQSDYEPKDTGIIVHFRVANLMPAASSGSQASMMRHSPDLPGEGAVVQFDGGRPPFRVTIS